jgi:hypothetical protein
MKIDYKEGVWYRDGSLLYTVQPCTFAGSLNWENKQTLQFASHKSDLVEDNNLLNNLLAVLNGEAS